jgi:SAM-dependent methyltransferase
VVIGRLRGTFSVKQAGMDRGGFTEPSQHWESRAQKFALRGDGLAAVCSYGMPGFYNRSIELCQSNALRPWLRLPAAGNALFPMARPLALDVGCGVARWSLRLARAGFQVTGIDLSPTMVRIARSNAAAARADCTFEVRDVTALSLRNQFDLILSVTVMQHVTNPNLARATIRRLADHLAPGGRLVLLEAAPYRETSRCNNKAFRVRPLHWYLEALLNAGLGVTAIRGVDPAPFKSWLLPWYGKLPRAVGIGALALSTAISLPLDLSLGPLARRASWHKVIVATAKGRSPPGATP